MTIDVSKPGYWVDCVRDRAYGRLWTARPMDAIRRYIVGPTPQEQVKTWQRSLRSEIRQVDRQIGSIVQGENKTKAQVRALAKKGDLKNCRILAREILRSRKSRNRMEVSKATLSSLSMQLNEQLATIKITGALQKSTVMMKEVNTLVKLPELTATMGRLQMEMTKAGIMDEMMTDALDMEDLDDMEDEADEEVNKVLGELTGEQFDAAGQVPTTPLSSAGQVAIDDEEDEADLNAMRSRLAALKE